MIRPPRRRFEPFVGSLEGSQAEGNLNYISANMPRLERATAEPMAAQDRLAGLQYRARLIRDQHEPPA